MEDSIKDRPEDLEVRFCCVCHKQYKYPEKDGSDLRCCSSACEEQLLDEQYEAIG